MKDFFEMDEFQFAKKLIDIAPEMKEEYYYGAQDITPNQAEILKGVNLLCRVFNYVKKLHCSYWDFGQMAECLKLIITENEVRFLADRNEVNYKEAVLREVKEGGNKRIAVIAAQLLDYYNSTYCIDPKFNGKTAFNVGMHNIIRAGAEGKVPGPEVDAGFPVRLKKYLDEYVVGQEQLKKMLAMSVYHYMIMGDYRPLLMIGDTGTGKNYTISILEKFLEKQYKIPVIVYDTSRITPNGFDGESVRDIIRLFKAKAKKMNAGTDRGIIYLDEICKIVLPNMDKYGRDVNALVQFQLMSVISGTVIEEVDTSKLLFILGGAFADLRKYREQKENKSRVGFWCEDEITERSSTLRDDLIKIGMQREFLGRISAIVEMERLRYDQIRQILLHEKAGPILRKKNEYALDGLELVIDEDVPDAIMDKVMQENLGARSALNILEELLGCYNYDMLEQGYKVLRIHSGMIKNSTGPVFEKGIFHEKDKRYCK